MHTKFADLCIVDAQNFGFFTRTQVETGDQIHDEQDETRPDERVRPSGKRIRKLVSDLDPVLVEPSSVNLGDPVQTRNVVRSEEGRADVSNKTTHAVDRENVEGVVDTEDKFQFRGIVGEAGTQRAKGQGCPDWNVTWNFSVRRTIRVKSLETYLIQE